jgi:hypothetical protein
MDQNQRRLPLFSQFHYGLLLLTFVLIATSCQFPGFRQNQTTCGSSVLKIGESTYQIKTIKPKEDGSLKIPSNKPDIAYWIEGTNKNYVFALSPTENNLALQNSLQGQEEATITWDNCNSTTYKLSAPQAGIPDNNTLLDQSVSGLTLFVQLNSSSAGFLIKGELSEETINAFNTPNSSEVQAEISLLDTSTSDDGKNISVAISVMNYGQSTITLSANDILLTSDGNKPIAPGNVEPSLPKEIQPGTTETFHIIFPRPSSATVTLKIFNAEYDLEGY